MYICTTLSLHVIKRSLTKYNLHQSIRFFLCSWFIHSWNHYLLYSRDLTPRYVVKRLSFVTQIRMHLTCAKTSILLEHLRHPDEVILWEPPLYHQKDSYFPLRALKPRTHITHYLWQHQPPPVTPGQFPGTPKGVCVCLNIIAQVICLTDKTRYSYLK